MLFKKFIASSAVAAVAASSLVPISSAAGAAEWNHKSTSHGPRVESRAFHDGGQRWSHWGDEHRHHDHTGRNLAIGAFATVLGIALAAEANHVHDDYYDERD